MPPETQAQQETLVRQATAVLQALKELQDQAETLAELVTLAPQDQQVRQAIRGLRVRRDKAVRQAARALRAIAVPPEIRVRPDLKAIQGRLDQLATEAIRALRDPPDKQDYKEPPDPREALVLTASLGRLAQQALPAKQDLPGTPVSRVLVAPPAIQGRPVPPETLATLESLVRLVQGRLVRPEHREDPPEELAPLVTPVRREIRESLARLARRVSAAIQVRPATTAKLVRLVRGE